VQIAFGQVTRSKAAVLGLSGVGGAAQKGPMVVAFCNGDLEAVYHLDLPKEKKSRTLLPFFGDFKGGAKCRQGMAYQLNLKQRVTASTFLKSACIALGKQT
jgi:hypothetical protein